MPFHNTYGTISESGDIRESTYIQDYTPGPAIENDGDEQEPITPAAPPVVEEQPAPVEEDPAPVQVPEQPIRPRTRQRARIEPAQDDEDEPDNRPIAKGLYTNGSGAQTKSISKQCKQK